VSVVHLDYSVLTTLQEVMEDEYPTLLDVFLIDSEYRISRLRQLMGASVFDLQELGMLAHSFKGSSSNMGALRLADLCRDLEERSRREDRSGLGELLAALDLEYSTVRRLFDAERQFFIAHP
jgi:HPt (histidine-containing phosphotransfer) domain-containing protein